MPATNDLRIDQQSVEFGDVWLASSRVRPLSLSNTGRASVTATVNTDTPFTAVETVTIQGGETVSFDVRFTPVALGTVQGALTIKTATEQLQVTLSGTGVNPPACDSTLCRTATLNPETLSCELKAVDDGSPCNDGCLEGTCSQGTCIGTNRVCDDQDRCTDDSCSPNAGCVHTPTQCPGDSLCSVGSCSATTGCTQTPAADGIACGPADCSTAMVCIAGQCVSRAVPEGGACGSESVCQQRGTCVSRQCVQPGPTQLKHVFTYATPSGSSLNGLVTDSQGNHFTVECTTVAMMTDQCQLISFSALGVERWRTPFTHRTNASVALRDSLMIAGERVISAIAPNWVDAFDATSGARSWSVDLSVLGISPTVSQLFIIRALAFNGIDEVLLIAEPYSSGTARLLGLSSANGTLRHAFPIPRGVSSAGVIIDTAGQIYFSHISGALPTTLETVTALDPQWNVLWQRSHAPMGGSVTQMLRATHRGQVLVTREDASETWSAAGAVLNDTLPAVPAQQPNAVWGDRSLGVMKPQCSTPACTTVTAGLLVIEQPGTTAALSHTIALPSNWHTMPWLTQRQSMLLASRLAVTPFTTELHEFSQTGEQLMRCPLEWSGVRGMFAGPTLSADQYAVITGVDSDGLRRQLEVFSVPGYSPATRGWASPRGSAALDSRAR